MHQILSELEKSKSRCQDKGSRFDTLRSKVSKSKKVEKYKTECSRVSSGAYVALNMMIKFAFSKLERKRRLYAKLESKRLVIIIAII